MGLKSEVLTPIPRRVVATVACYEGLFDEVNACFMLNAFLSPLVATGACYECLLVRPFVQFPV